jgi:hypothetical protein
MRACLFLEWKETFATGTLTDAFSRVLTGRLRVTPRRATTRTALFGVQMEISVYQIR